MRCLNKTKKHSRYLNRGSEINVCGGSVSFIHHTPQWLVTTRRRFDRRIFADVSPGRSEVITPLTDGKHFCRWTKTFQVVLVMSPWPRLSSVLIGSDRLINNPQLDEHSGWRLDKFVALIVCMTVWRERHEEVSSGEALSLHWFNTFNSLQVYFYFAVICHLDSELLKCSKKLKLHTAE